MKETILQIIPEIGSNINIEGSRLNHHLLRFYLLRKGRVELIG